MAGLLFVVFSMVLLPRATSAHAALISTDPADGAVLETAPDHVTLKFSESVSVVGDGTKLYTRGSEPRALEPTAEDGTVTVPLPTDLADGTYVLQWRVISADSHPIAGTLTFSIGQPAQMVEVPVVSTDPMVEWGTHLSIWAKYLGLLTTLGLVIGGWSYARADWQTLMRLAKWTAALAIAGSLLELPFAAAAQTGQSVWRWASLRQLDSVTLIAVMVTIAGLIVFLLTSGRPQWRMIATAGVGAAGLAPLLTGHTRTKSPESVVLLADAIHILAGGFWLGGLVILTLGLRRTGSLRTFNTPQGAVAAVSRFSALAAYSVVLLGISGSVMAWIILDAPRDLIDTGYGRDLLIKVGLVAVTVALAAINRFRILPALASDHDHALGRLRRLVLAELILLIAVVGVTSVLVQQNPNHVVQASEPAVVFEGSTALDKDHTASVWVTQMDEDTITILVVIEDASGPIDQLSSGVTAEWMMPAHQMGPIPLTLVWDEAAGGYTGTASLPMPGDWDLTIRANIDRFTDSRGSVTVPLP